MIVQGTVVDINLDATIAKQGGGSYHGATLAYRGDDGKLQEQAFHDNAFKFNGNLKLQLAELDVGDVFHMEKEKKGDFWNVTSVHKGPKPVGSGGAKASNSSGDAASGGAKTTGKVTGSNYETPEERARRQRYIVRQSSITSAIAMLSVGLGAKSTLAPDEVIDVAKKFESYVFEEASLGGLEELSGVQGDIPA